MIDIKPHSHWIHSRTKRIFDICIVLASIPVLSIVILLLMITIICIDRSWPMFTQQRIGRNGIPFRFYKLNTMGRHRSAQPSGGARDRRATKLGRLLRWLILDEIPQIVINVLKGDMSLVGPRPLLQADINLMRRKLSSYHFSTWYAAYCAARPGWTGRFGVASRRFRLHSSQYLYARRYHDILYLRQASAWLDIRTMGIHIILPFLDSNWRVESCAQNK